MGAVKSDLMHSPRLNHKLYKRERPLTLQNGPFANSPHSPFFNHAHALFVRLARYERFKSAMRRLRCAMKNREIRFYDTFMRLEISPESTVRKIVLGKNHNAARFNIKSVHHTGALHRTDTAHCGAFRRKVIGERLFFAPRGAMHDSPRRFIYYDNIVVFIYDFKFHFSPLTSILRI